MIDSMIEDLMRRDQERVTLRMERDAAIERARLWEKLAGERLDFCLQFKATVDALIEQMDQAKEKRRTPQG